ncbi:MAG: hypothetical protein A2942_03635 [Candidatus Lloydbacteria bacterium RIFCSPLOWO2_01_FULL_50_20]|uniref:Uncharacterized protein n=1 Tax=Candidatus Lloydbacteria bacterium RIFCSPLOWO2_01_FULL_50_20 TaxID=1798665 RepID=A0A1G2DHY1_9BACT|nr:MAG: hypothetical protein A3C13_02825 [Candidatus Lloydbacteria bacterium RIFCSPHIGHO2_02_FULL_50_11]OGZ13284.1 MAG: hypothetical protein A2942_03635 [Candidatus Lloydbacteria bacterium RIFCSPLOWO2_01_FULL_50_20]
MDTDGKTLAELSHEPKEKRYVTLDVGSKISGYTKDYLDRLCRLNKIEHRSWIKGGFVVELDSLLRETHTLLISDEEINFIDKRELTGPREETVTPSSSAQTVPQQNSRLPAQSAVEAAQPAAQSEKESLPSISRATIEIPLQRTPIRPAGSPASIPTSVPVSTPFASSFARTSPAQALPQESPTPPAVKDVEISAPVSPAAPSQVPSPVFTPSLPREPIPPPRLITITPQQNSDQSAKSDQKPSASVSHSDEWDALLFGSVNDIPEPQKAITPPAPSLYQTPSEYRPIRTSVDPTPHHDDAPLFPFSLENALKKENVPVEQKATSVSTEKIAVPIPESQPIRPLHFTLPISPQTPVLTASSLPKLAEEHHLTTPEPHSLAKSPGPN